MANTLKKINQLPLTAIVTSTVIVLASIQYGLDQIVGQINTMKDLGLAVVAATVSYILANALPANIKHWLVYVGYKYALPGHRCHKVCASDPRLDMSVISSRWPEIFSDEADDENRNALWYAGIYSDVKDAPEVLQSHGNFLLYRDAFSALLIMLVLLMVWLVAQRYFDVLAVQNWVLWFLVVEVVLFMHMAREWGNRMVVNSVACAVGR